MKAIWNGVVIAESNDTIIVENNHYFPPQAVKTEFLNQSQTHTTCHWKGVASYYSIEVEGKTNADAAWFYPNPKPMAKDLKNYIAFWRGVQIVKD